MKKNVFILFCFILLSVACRREGIRPINNGSELSSQLIADIFSTKAKVDDVNINWTEGDQIQVFTGSSISIFSLISGDGTSHGVFEGNASLKNAYAKYPFISSDYYDGTQIHTYIDKDRYYELGKDNTSLILASTVSDNGEVLFKNITSVIKIPLLGRSSINKIHVQAISKDINICGDMLISFIDEEPVLTVNSERSVVDIGNEFDLHCCVKLDEEDLTNIYIGVPPQNYPHGFVFSFFTEDGYKFTKKVQRDLSLNAGGIYSLDPITISPDCNVLPSSSLSGHGSQEDPFIISSLEDLLYFRDAVNSESQIISANDNTSVFARDTHVKLSKDIDLSVYCGPELRDWVPISDNRSYFQMKYVPKFNGIFDGDSHKISGLYMSDYHLVGGFFGVLGEKSIVRNLEIDGEIFIKDSGLLCYETLGLLDNITTRGNVYSQSTAAGICGNLDRDMTNCVNYANVYTTGDMYYHIAGCVATIGLFGNVSTVQNCHNYGDVVSLGRCPYAAGVVGRVNSGIFWSNRTYEYVINCTNSGVISSSYIAGGIVGLVCFSGRILNCVNYGPVKMDGQNDDTDKGFGGICGSMEDFSRDSFSEGYICNCLNYAKVCGADGCTGAIVGVNEQKCTNCWWLNEIDGGMDYGGPNLGSFTTSLSEGQLKGREEFGYYYKNYDNLIDALNDWAYNNSTTECPLNGWEYRQTDGWPSIKQSPAVPPIQGDYYLVTPAEFYSFNTYSHPISLFVSSSSEVSISLPSWIKLNETKKGNDPTNHDVTFELTVEKNKSGARRRGEIMLANADNCWLSVVVNQSYTLVSEDYSRNGNVVRVQSAKRGNGIDLVFMGDGYLDKDIQSGKYDADMRRAVEAFFDVEPYTSFKDMFNVSYVELVSESNLFDGSMSTSLDGYFGEDTRVGGNDNRVYQYCQSALGRDNLDDVTAIILLNERRYSGTCYMYYNTSTDYGLGFAACYFALGTTTTGTTSMESVLRHEAGGHGFAKLADEYAYIDYGKIPDERLEQICELQNYGWYSNVDRSSDPFQVSWTHFLQKDEYEVEGIGVYEGAATYWSGIYRPTYNSIMNNNTGGFNAPSREAIYYKIHKLAYGPSWNYDRNEFYEYDKVNLNTTKSSSFNNSIIEGFIPLHSPIIVK